MTRHSDGLACAIVECLPSSPLLTAAPFLRFSPCHCPFGFLTAPTTLVPRRIPSTGGVCSICSSCALITSCSKVEVVKKRRTTIARMSESCW
jgi:hypothetical protein